MLTEKDYCDYDTCVALKELGFNNLVDWYFNEEKSIVSSLARYRNTYIPRVSLYEAQKWLREEKKIEVNATYDNVVELHWHWYMKSLTNRNQTISIVNHDSYEQALLTGIKEAIKILKEKQDDKGRTKESAIQVLRTPSNGG